jgi:hypothetical protein
VKLRLRSGPRPGEQTDEVLPALDDDARRAAR